MDEISFYIDPVGAMLVALFFLGLVVLLSIDCIRFRVRRGKPRYYSGKCYYCGEPYDGAHWCKHRRN